MNFKLYYYYKYKTEKNERYCNIPKISPGFLCRFPIISLENLRVFPWKSTADLSTWKIILNFHVNCCFTYIRNFSVDSPPPCIRHLRGFPAESAWFCLLGQVCEPNVYYSSPLGRICLPYSASFFICIYLKFYHDHPGILKPFSHFTHIALYQLWLWSISDLMIFLDWQIYHTNASTNYRGCIYHAHCRLTKNQFANFIFERCRVSSRVESSCSYNGRWSYTQPTFGCHWTQKFSWTLQVSHP